DGRHVDRRQRPAGELEDQREALTAARGPWQRPGNRVDLPEPPTESIDVVGAEGSEHAAGPLPGIERCGGVAQAIAPRLAVDSEADRLEVPQVALVDQALAGLPRWEEPRLVVDRVADIGVSRQTEHVTRLGGV